MIRASSSSSTLSSPPGMLDGDRALAPAVRHRCGRGRDRARAGGARLAGPALPDEHGQLVRTVDPDELDVRPLREALVALDQRAEPEEVVATRVEPDDCVRVPDGHRRELDPLIAELDRLGLPHLDLSDPHRDRAVVADRRRVGAAGDADRHLRRPRRGAQPGRRDPAPVAGELRDRAVGVPDHDLGLRSVRADHLDDAVRADAVADVAEPPRQLGRHPLPRRRGSCYRARATSRIARCYLIEVNVACIGPVILPCGFRACRKEGPRRLRHRLGPAIPPKFLESRPPGW